MDGSSLKGLHNKFTISTLKLIPKWKWTQNDRTPHTVPQLEKEYRCGFDGLLDWSPSGGGGRKGSHFCHTMKTTLICVRLPQRWRIFAACFRVEDRHTMSQSRIKTLALILVPITLCVQININLYLPQRLPIPFSSTSYIISQNWTSLSLFRPGFKFFVWDLKYNL